MFMHHDKFKSAKQRLDFLRQHVGITDCFKIDKIVPNGDSSELKPIDQSQIHFFKKGGLEMVIGTEDIKDAKEGEKFYNCALVDPQSQLIIYFSYKGKGNYEPYLVGRHYHIKYDTTIFSAIFD